MSKPVSYRKIFNAMQMFSYHCEGATCWKVLLRRKISAIEHWVEMFWQLCPCYSYLTFLGFKRHPHVKANLPGVTVHKKGWCDCHVRPLMNLMKTMWRETDNNLLWTVPMAFLNSDSICTVYYCRVHIFCMVLNSVIFTLSFKELLRISQWVLGMRQAEVCGNDIVICIMCVYIV